MLDGFLSCGLVLALVLLASGFVFRSSPAARREQPQTSPSFYPVLGLLVAALLIVFGSHVHWGELVALIGGAR